MIDRRNEVFRALAHELLSIQQGSVEDAIALLDDGDYFFNSDEMEQIVNHIEDLAKILYPQNVSE